jgi:glutamate/aspartate transport system substrate-binding protein
MSDVFLCYRRNDSPQTAWHLASLLNRTHKTFIDTHIRGGALWDDTLVREIENCSVFLCFVGERWLERNENGELRVNDEHDYVRKEISLAISLNKKILPILVNGGSLPNREELHESIQSLMGSEFMNLTFVPPAFYADADKIIRRVNQLVREQRGYIRYIAGKVRQIVIRSRLVIIVAATICIPITILSTHYVETLHCKQACEELKRADVEPKRAEISINDDIISTNKIVIGVQNDSYPFSFERNGKTQGFSYELCVDFAKKAYDKVSSKVGIEVKVVNFDDKISDTKQGKIHLECNATSITTDRQEVVSFIPLGVHTKTVCMSHKADKTCEFQQDNIILSGKKVVRVGNTTNNKNFENNSRSGGTYYFVKDYDEIFNRMLNGESDIAFLDDMLFYGFLSNNRYRFKRKIKFSASNFRVSYALKGEFEQYGVMIPKGDKEFESKIKDAMNEIYGNKQDICSRYKKWFWDTGIIKKMREGNPQNITEMPKDDLMHKCAEFF